MINQIKEYVIEYLKKEPVKPIAAGSVLFICLVLLAFSPTLTRMGRANLDKEQQVSEDGNDSFVSQQDTTLKTISASQAAANGLQSEASKTSFWNQTESVEQDIEEEESEYSDLALAKVTNYVNVRKEPNTDSEIVGKIYDGAVAQVLSISGPENDWYQIISGNCEGYIKAEYFLYGDEAQEAIEDYVTRYATVIADRLNVREEPDKQSHRIGYVDHGERVKLEDNLGDWLKVSYGASKTGYVAAEFTTISEEFVYAVTLEEEQAQIASMQAQIERETASEEEQTENTTIVVNPPNVNYADTSELRRQILEYASQFLGNRYVHGGKTLEGGTDCSGFTSLVYAPFGYSLSRIPAGQLNNNGRSVSLEEAKPGDIVCYGKSRCTHVALYMGNGQIIHSANSRKGVVIYDVNYDHILGIKNVID